MAKERGAQSNIGRSLYQSPTTAICSRATPTRRATSARPLPLSTPRETKRKTSAPPPAKRSTSTAPLAAARSASSAAADSAVAMPTTMTGSTRHTSADTTSSWVVISRDQPLTYGW
jgi:hypothetical protein